MMVLVSRFAWTVITLVSPLLVRSAEYGAGGLRCNHKFIKSQEKHGKCDAEGEGDKGMTEHCEGGFCMNLEVTIKPTDMAEIMSQTLESQVKEALEGLFLPDDETLMELAQMQQDLLDGSSSSGVTMEKTMYFHGSAQIEGNCQVTFGFEDGKMYKKNKCDFKVDKKGGKGRPDKEDSAAAL